MEQFATFLPDRPAQVDAASRHGSCFELLRRKHVVLPEKKDRRSKEHIMSRMPVRIDSSERNSAKDKEQPLNRLNLYLKQRGYKDSHASAPRGGTAGPAAKDPPRSMREQYGISAMLYGLVVLLGGIYCVMTDAGRLASEQGFAIDAAAWTPKFSAKRESAMPVGTGRSPAAMPHVQTFSDNPLPAPTSPVPLLRRRPSSSRSSAVQQSSPVSVSPDGRLEDGGPSRYVSARDGA